MKKIKNLILGALSLCAVTIVFLSSCSEDTINNDTFESVNKKEGEIERHIVYINWDSFGRTSRDCKGFGLCHYSSCWFCCTENGHIVPCPEEEASSTGGYGKIVIDKQTNQGHLIIQLDPEKEIENEAIAGREILHIDEDIVNGELRIVLLQGEYEFDEEVGKYGGYLVEAVLLD